MYIESTPNDKAVLYLDVDDTILFATDERYVFRPECEKLIAKLSEKFDCRWLTNWQWTALQKLLTENAPSLLSCVKYCDWSWAKCKAEAVVAGPQNFWWLEDPFSTGSIRLLAENGTAERYIVVDPFAIEGLTIAVQQLVARVADDSHR